MGDIEALKKLFKHIQAVTHERPSDDFFNEWLSLMGLYLADIPGKAWDQIKLQEKFYFNLKVWYDKCEFIELENNVKKEETEPVLKRSDRDAQTKQWTENINNFYDGKITRHQYLDNALDTGQMAMHEYDSEVQRCKHLEYPLDQTIKSTIVVKEFLS